METIKTYLENMFRALPKNQEMNKLKNDLLINMEDKYNELKNQGKSENEAIGIVISEFGNIEELAKELNIDIEEKGQNSLPHVGYDAITEFLQVKKSSALITALGVMLCILAPAALIFSLFITSYSLVGIVIGLVMLLGLIATAVSMFIFSDHQMEKYKYLEGSFDMSFQTKKDIQIKNESFSGIKLILTIVSIILFVLSPLLIIIPAITMVDENLIVLSVVGLLILISIGVFILVYSGSIQDGYNMILKKEEYAEKKYPNKAAEIFSEIWWPVIVCIYLLWSFISGAWHISWIIWPIAGVLFGGISAIIKGINSTNDN